MNTQQRRELLEAVVRNCEQALAGPLGYNDRQEVTANGQKAMAELRAMRKPCPVCLDGACEVKSVNCGQ